MSLLRPILLVHRYLAVAVGLLVALWCLSGFVMMYQDFPWFTPEERLRTLEPLDLADCCNTAFLEEDTEPLRSFRIEMLLGEPVLRQGGVTPIQLRTGSPVKALTQAELLDVAALYADRRGLPGASPEWLGEIEVDQWSVQAAARNHPVQHLALRDAAHSEIYVNGRTGEIFQDTTRRERLLAWLGAIPHWLYPTALRSNGPLWSQVVIWTAVAGTFLTVTGLYVGIARLRRRRDGRMASPFRGWWYWHHMLGLVFGLLTLTWVFSGLLTVNPWGLLVGDGGAQIRAQLRGEAASTQLRQFLEAAPQLPAGEFSQLQGEVFDGRLQVIARRADGTAVRLDAQAQPHPLDAATIERRVRGLDTGVASFVRLDRPDAYFYGHKSDARFPVYRAILADAGRTRLYIDPVTGSTRVVDTAVRRSRWLVSGLHSLDFRGLRTRPVWDIVVLLLLAGVTALAITGSWMALKRIRADLARQGRALAASHRDTAFNDPVRADRGPPSTPN